MSKYSYSNCFDWFENLSPETNFICAVEQFCIDGYQPFVRRKTVTPKEKEVVKSLREMLELIETHVQEIENKGK